MSRLSATTILALFLSASFFMPFFYWNNFEMNAFNLMLSDRVPAYKYFLLLPVLIVLFYLFGMLSEEKTTFSRRLLSWVPLASLSFVFIAAFINASTDNFIFETGNIFSNTGAGFWLALSAAFLLAFVNRQTKRSVSMLKNK